jgi:helicase
MAKQTSDALFDLSLDTISRDKQALIFVNTKRSAERVAEDLSRKVRLEGNQLESLAVKSLKALSRPTKQCERLAKCLKKGVAFHHAGLAAKQRELVEDSFRDGTVKIIACTPTLAFGLDLPAFRVIMRDVKRYTSHGYNFIPVLEYHQMTGRAGRPKYDKYGEAITLASTKEEADDLVERFIRGKPEAIYSKLAVEPVLRTYLLSLIAASFVNTKKEIMDFFEQTFWAYQYRDMHRLESIIERMLGLLEEWEFIRSNADDFRSADKLDSTRYRATLLGQRVAELYLDPLTAFHMTTSLRRATSKELTPFSFLQMVCHTLEMRPLLKVKAREYERFQEYLAEYEDTLIMNEPSMFEPDYEDFLYSVKTSLFMQDWLDEKDEEFLLQKFDIRPGEIRVKLDIADWLLYATYELNRILNFKELSKHITRTRMRLKYGVKEELLPLLKLKDIGRVRARKLYSNNLRTITDIKKAELLTLTQILGKKTAQNVKDQLGQKVEPVKKGKRKGQRGLVDY